MRIVLFTHKLARGGVERMVSLLSLNLPREIKSTIVLMENEIFYPHKEDIKLLKALEPGSNFFKRLKTFFQRYNGFKKILKEIRPDYVVTFSTTSSLISVLLFPRTIVTIHSVPSIVLGSRMYCSYYRLLIRFICFKASKIIVVSEGIKQDLRKNFKIKKNIEIIYNSVDLKNISLLAQETELDNRFQEWKKDNFPILITAGTLRKQKGYYYLLRIFKDIRKEINCKLVIMGTGELDGYLRKFAKDLFIENEVLFLGFQKNPYKYFANADIFVFSSLYEGFGIAVLEAMACGLPVISTDCYSGPREILDPDAPIDHQTEFIKYAKYGILVPVCDEVLYEGQEKLTLQENMFSQAILKLLQDSKIRGKYATLALHRSKDFNIILYIRQWLKILNIYDKI